MGNRANTMVAILVLTGCTIPPIALALASRLIPGFDMQALYLPKPVSTLPVLTFSLIGQTAICIAAFGLKPIYELFALILFIRLRHEPDQETAALRYGIIAFFLGENACALNYLLFNENSFIFEYLHTYGMLICFSFVSYAILKAIDKRIFKYSLREENCAFLFFCQRCYKHHQTSCTVRRLYQLSIVALVIIAFMPMTATLGGYHVAGDVFGTRAVFGHSLAQQILEARIWPSGAVVFLGIAFITFQLKKEEGFETAKIFLAAGLGLLGFSLMRFFVFWSYENNPIWADIWEEITEFLFVISLYFFFFLSRDKRKPARNPRSEKMCHAMSTPTGG
jgi:hypothetical protein